jgi:3'(2'), 5'-bisphosphate nucleotidase
MGLPDADLARDLATGAGGLLLGLRADLGFVEPKRLRDTADRSSHEFLLEQLRAARPTDAVLSEEGVDDPGRLRADRVWIVDPLDGTREYGEPGRTDWAVHVALWQRDVGLAVGAVALPARDLTLVSSRAESPASTYDGPPRVVASRTRAPDLVKEVTESLGGVTVPMGSAGAKIAAVVLGEADVYVHAGGQYEWDSAAPVAVARAAGLHTSRLDGSPLLYNQRDPWLPDLIVCRPDLAPRVLKVTGGR